MRFLVYILALITSLACGPSRKSNPVDVISVSSLSPKVELYKQNQERDENGFIMVDKCDSLFFSGLLGAAIPGSVDITAARSIEGTSPTWHRRPAQDCGPSFGNSRSTTSRDMLLGLMWHMWKNKQLDLAVELMEDLKSNTYYLRGEGSAGELLVNPNLLNTLAHLIRTLGGPRYSLELAYPTSITAGTGFESHLAVWHILLRGDIQGELSSGEFSTLEELAKREPTNPLYKAAYSKYLDGQQKSSVELLLDPKHWPSDRLPTTAEHCSDWPVQRNLLDADGNPSKDWLPCAEENKIHSGAELLIIYYLILGGQ